MTNFHQILCHFWDTGLCQWPGLVPALCTILSRQHQYYSFLQRNYSRNWMRTNCLSGLLWVGEGMESQEKKGVRNKKVKTEKESLPNQKNIQFYSSNSTLKRLLPSLFNMPQLGFVSRQCSFTRQSKPISLSTSASPLSSTSFTGLVPALALKLAQLPKCGRTPTSASFQWVSSSQLNWSVEVT